MVSFNQQDVMRLRLEVPKEQDSKDKVTEEEKVLGLSGGCCFDFHKGVRHIFVVGTEEGKIYKCSTTYNSQYLLSFEVGCFVLFLCQVLNCE
jgi:dynein intermediate chain 1